MGLFDWFKNRPTEQHTTTNNNTNSNTGENSRLEHQEAEEVTDNKTITVADVFMEVIEESQSKMSSNSKILLIDSLRNIINSGFSKVVIDNVLNQSSGTRKEMCIKFLNKIGKLP